jgi:undecaprenyl phosphate-alpha-L-ara4N flippase subunit ArnE
MRLALRSTRRTKLLPLNVLLTLIGGSCCAAAGTLLLKAGAAGRDELLEFINIYVVVGLALYALGSAMWLFSLSSEPLTVVYPFTALSFVLVLLGAVVFQGERPSLINLAGVLVVLAGIGLVVWGRR